MCSLLREKDKKWHVPAASLRTPVTVNECHWDRSSAGVNEPQLIASPAGLCETMLIYTRGAAGPGLSLAGGNPPEFPSVGVRAGWKPAAGAKGCRKQIKGRIGNAHLIGLTSPTNTFFSPSSHCPASPPPAAHLPYAPSRCCRLPSRTSYPRSPL